MFDAESPPSSDTAGWRRFLQVFAWTFGGAAVVLVGILVWANPYRNIPFASQDRPLIDVNQRYLYPAVARDSQFDSAVFGTSSIRLLRPSDLNDTFGGHFAELAMNSSTAYEQSRIADLFMDVRKRRGAPVRTVVFGIDRVWCGRGETYTKFTDRPFPPWMYDNNPWNDLLYLFNGKAVELAGRVIGWQLGLSSEVHYDHTGYGNFLPPRAEYDLTRARQHIYGQPAPKPIVAQDPPVTATPAERATWRYPTHALMADLLEQIPDDTRVILAFVPYHVFVQPRPGSQQALDMAECKQRLTTLAAARPNALVVDFMRPSPLTTRDENYWDPLHYSVDTAHLLVGLLGRAATGQPDPQGRYVILYDRLAGARPPAVAGPG